MVKNITGGNKSKRFASRSSSSTLGRVRKSSCREEVYAVVEKMSGGDICIVKSKQDESGYKCVIRGKFRGRNKSSNTLKIGTWVLVGMREWESSRGKPNFCDLLEVYTPPDIDVLKQTEPRELLPIFSNEDEDDLFDRSDKCLDDNLEDEPVDESDYTFDGVSFDDI